MCGLGLVAGYALYGATWLIMKTEGPVQARARRNALHLLPVFIAFLVLVSIWTPFMHPMIAARWFTLPNIFYLAPVPLLTAIALLQLGRGLVTGAERTPFLCMIAIFSLSFVGLGTSLYPHIVPYSMTIWQAAAAPRSQMFLLAGIAVMLPIVLAYTGYNYWVFRGKLGKSVAYH